MKSYIEDTEGVIDIAQIFLNNGFLSNFFISGPPAMIKSFKRTLVEKGVPPSNVLTDEWE